MPIKQKDTQHDLSLRHFKRWLKKNFKNVQGHTLELDSLFKTFENTLGKFDSMHGMANSRARLRMTTLIKLLPQIMELLLGQETKLKTLA